jgi:hypothetical protein
VLSANNLGTNNLWTLLAQNVAETEMGSRTNGLQTFKDKRRLHRILTKYSISNSAVSIAEREKGNGTAPFVGILSHAVCDIP